MRPTTALRRYTTDPGRLERVKNDLAFWLRRKIFDLRMRECAPPVEARAAEFGGSRHRSHPAHYFFEALSPYPDRVTAVGRENASRLTEQSPGMRIRGDRNGSR